MTKVILISGKAEAGKTTTANMLKDILMEIGNVAIIPYGQYVKDTSRMIFGWDGNKDEFGRHLLQWWGTDVVRKKDPDFWANTVVRLAEVAKDELDYIIVDDCRFPNEITCWDGKNPYITIRVERPGYSNHLTPEQRLHPSETALDDHNFDVTINAMSKDELQLCVNYVLDEVIQTLKVREQEVFLHE